MAEPASLVPFVVAITGMSGSGKSWLVNNLVKAMPEKIAVLRYDDYYRPHHEQQNDENGITNFDLPSALDDAKFREDLLQLIEGHPVLVNEYHFELENPEPTVRIISPAPVIIAEGLFLQYHPEIDALFSARILVEADRTISLERRLKRDAEERGIPYEKSLYQWNNHVIPAYENYMFPYASLCDLVLQNADTQEQQMEKVWELIRENAHPSVIAALANS